MNADKRALMYQIQLDLGLRGEFEHELRKALTEFRVNPRLGRHTLTVTLDLEPLTYSAPLADK